MRELEPLEIGAFMGLFNRGGYVLDFSTNDFDVFTMECVGVALCQKYQMSKGKSLLAFMHDFAVTNDLKIKLMQDLFAYYENEYLCGWRSDEEYRTRYEKCKEIIRSLSSVQSPLTPIAEELSTKFSSKYLSQQIDSMMKLQEENPTDAIGKAKELIESCCKTILDDLQIVQDKDWSVNQLAQKTLEQPHLLPKDIPNTAREAENMRALLGNLLQIATRMGDLRNAYGSGHGKKASFKGLESRHAKLAVGASITLVNFLWDTHEERAGQ